MKTKLLLAIMLSTFDSLRNFMLKAFVFTIINCLILISANAQIKEQWLKEYNGPVNSETYSSSIIIDNNDNILIAGSTQTGNTGFNYFIRKYTQTGDVQWTTFYDHPSIDVNWRIKSFIQDANKNIYILGSVGGWDSLQDILIAKFNPNGVFLWAEVYNGPDNLGDAPQAIAVDNSGNIYVTADVGGMDHQGLNQTKYWGIVKYDSNFIKQWERIIDYNGYLYVRSSPLGIKIDDAGNIYVTGVRSSIWIGYKGTMTIKYSPSGNELWRHEYSGQNGNSGYMFPSKGNNLIITPNNNIFTACLFYDTHGTVPNDTVYSYLLTVLYSPAGNILSQTVDMNECNLIPKKLRMGQDGNIYLVGSNTGGFTSSNNPSCFSDTTFTVIKFDLSGNQQSKVKTPFNSNIDIWSWENSVVIDTAYNIYAACNAYAQVNNWASYSYWPVTLKANSIGNLEWLAEYNRGYGEGFITEVALDSKGNIYSVGYLFNADYTNSAGILLKYCPKCNNLISGNVYRENDGNCIQDTIAGEAGLKNRMVKLSPSSLYAMTDNNGYYSFLVDSGNYEVTQIISDTILNTRCSSTPVSYQITVLPESNNTGNNFGNMVALYCPHLWVDISTSLVRRCRRNIYTVSYCNNGTDTALNAFIKVRLDTSIIFLSSTIPWSIQSDNSFTFNLGNLNPEQCGNFYITDSVSCNVAINSALCAEAIIYPDIICAPVDTVWDKSSISITGECVNDSLACFTIYNNGLSMTGQSQYRIFVNNVLMFSQNFQLNAGDSLIACFPANGNTIRFEADQRPGHPGHSHPKKIIEGCGTPSDFGYVTSVAQDDADDIKDIDCQIVRGSFDPNEKLVQPEGITSNNYISVTDELEYHINFQNTGNDTAFFIIIKDTLSEYLDHATVLSGASSHPYSFRIYGDGILEWTFNNIMLPDSNVNETASHGFVKFSVKQKADNPKGCIIKNSVDIYFDYNAPVKTNEVWNIYYDTTLIGINKPVIYDNKTDIRIYPNPFRISTTIEIKSLILNYKSSFNFVMYDLLGREVKNLKFSNNKLQIDRNDLPNGMYFYYVKSENKNIGAGKIIIE